MDEQNSKKNSISSKSVVAKKTTASPNGAHRSQHMTQNFLLIWVDANINESSQDCKSILTELRTVANDVTIFSQPDHCTRFLNNMVDGKAFVIVSGSLGQQLVPTIHAMPQLNAIYVFCGNKAWHEEWTKKWTKIKGVHTTITPICEALKTAANQCNQRPIPVSFVSMSEGATGENLDQLEPSFMYTQIFKEILLDMKYDGKSIKDFTDHCRRSYKNDTDVIVIINEFEREYRSKLAIWWYTRNCFIYDILNRALRTLEADVIISMGFFICDLHRQIAKLHRQQVSFYHKKRFIVYRGQSLSTTDFQKLYKTKGGLMSFNSFLSTSRSPEVSFNFAENALAKTDMVGIFFQMSIDPSVSSVPFATIDQVSYIKNEEEILFSMHAIFRVSKITQDKHNDRLYYVDLELTADDDQQLRSLTEHIRKEAGDGTGWARLSALLLKIGQFEKAEELYKVLLEQTTDAVERATHFNSLGYVKDQQGDFENAIRYLEKGLDIQRKTLPSNHPSLAMSYNNIGEVYRNKKDYSKALSSHEKALEIYRKTLHRNHPDLATSYNNIGLVCNQMGENSKALLCHEKALEIRQISLPPNHPSLATSYNNIALVYNDMKEYSKALSSHEKALGINEKSLPPNHPDLAGSYNNIASIYHSMKQYSKALSYFERALNIFKTSLPPNHPNIKAVQGNIEFVKKKCKEVHDE